MPVADCKKLTRLSAALRMYFEYEPHLSTGIRWITNGVLRNGVRVKLRGTRIGGRWYVTPDDVAAFIAALNDDSGEPAENPSDAARRAKEAGKALEALGC